MIPSTPEDWQWSVYEYNRTWVGEDAEELEFANGINHGDRHQVLTNAAQYYSVLRNIPAHRQTRAAIFELVLGADEPINPDDRFMTICRLVNDATDVVIQNGHRNVRLISAISKFLMLRFPEHSFVYDNNAKITLARAWGLGTGAFGDFGLFYDAWKCCPLLMINSIAGAGIAGFDNAGAARIVDKFLWLKGSNEPNRPIPPEAPESHRQWVMDTGTAIWNRLREQGLTAPPEDAQH